MLRLALASLRARWLSLAGSVVALTAGVALVTAAGATINAATAQRSGPSRRLHADLLVQGEPHRHTPEGYAFTLAAPPLLPLSTVDTVAAVPGVVRVVADRSFPVPGGTGYGWTSASLTPYALVSGRAPAADDEVVTDSARASAHVDGRDYRVVGRVRAGAPAGEHPVFFTDAEAARVSGTPDRVSALAVFTTGDPAAVARAIDVPGARVLAGDRRRLADGERYDDASMLLGMLAAIAAFVAVFVVASTVAYAVGQRRRELGLLRALGMRRRTVRRLVHTEALLTGAVSAAAGVVVGAVAAPVLARILVAAGVAPPDFTVPLRPGVFAGPAALGATVGVLAAVLGAAAAARRAGAVSPLEAMREVLVERRVMTRARWLGGTAALAVGAGLLALLPFAPVDGRLALALVVCLPLVTAAGLLSPAVAGRLAAVPATTVPARLARANLRVAVRRTAAVAAPVLVTVGLGASLLGVTGVLAAATAADARTRYAAPLVVLPTGPGLPAAALDRVARTPGVATEVSIVDTDVYAVAHRALRAQHALGVDGSRVGSGLRLGRVDGDLAALTGDSVAVSRAAGATLGWRLGARVRAYLADGQPATLTVVAVFDGSPLGDGILLPQPLAAAHDPRPEPDRALLTLVPGHEPDAVAAALHGTDEVVMPTAAWLDRAAAAQRTGMRLGAEILAGVALAYTLLSVVNTVAMAAGTRLAEYGRLRLAGARRRQVLAMVAWEATGVTAAGVALGGTVAAVTVGGAWLSLRAPADAFAFPWPEVAVLADVCLALTVTSMLATTWLGLRVRPIDAAAVRE